jgi:hypothetical protein
MTDDLLETARRLDAAEIRWRDGRLSARVVFRLVLFFDGGGTEAGQIAAMETLADLASDVSGHLTHMQTAGPHTKVEPFDLPRFIDRSGAAIAAAFAHARQPEDTDLDLAVFGQPFVSPRTPGTITPFGGSVVASGPTLTGTADISVLEFSTPLMWDAPGGYRRQIDRTLRAAARLRPLHGLAGFGLQVDRINASTTDEAAGLPALARFPGLHCSLDRPFAAEISVRRTVADRLFSVNWLTVVGDPMLVEIGGAQALADRLGPSCPVHGYDGGVVVQAGAHPQTGNAQTGDVPDDYRRVNAALRPLRFEDYRVGIQPVEPPLDPRDATLRWVRRFD